MLPAEPNNASPLNVEAAELWDDVEAVRLALQSCSVIATDGSYHDLQFKVELAKHYRPLPEDE